MSLVQNLQVWKEGVQCYNEGDFQSALKKFTDMNDASAKITFNIARIYMSLCELKKALETFQLVIKKDEHLAVGHFMLGVVNLMCTRHADALINFNETFRNLRGSKFIDYKQLGMRYKLFKCEVLLNRAVCLSSLGYTDSAVEDLLAALQCKVEPRHSIIDTSLNKLQSGKDIEFLVMDAIFQPSKSKTANLEKRDYLGKAQVVIDTGDYETMEAPGHLRGRHSTSSTSSSDSGEQYRVLYDFTAQSQTEVSVKVGDVITVSEKADDGWFTMMTNDARKTGLVPGSYLEKIVDEDQTSDTRQALLTDLRKKESRQSLRRVQQPPNKQIPRLPSDAAKFGKPNKTANLGGGNISPKLTQKSRPAVEVKVHAGPPKFRRKSVENMLGKAPCSDSPTLSKKLPGVPKLKPRSSDSDDDNDGYEEIPEITPVQPYAVHDVLSPAERMVTNGKKGPERPVPPPKSGFTLKPREPPPAIAPRFPRASTISNNALSVFDQKLQTPVFPTAIPKPLRTPPKPPSSPKRDRRPKSNGHVKEVRNQMVAVEFVISTSLILSPSTTAEELQSIAQEAISKNLSCLWCEKDGKRIRLGDHNASNILDVVKDGKLRVWCSP